MRTMYLDVTKKVGDASAIKTAEQIIKELEEKLAVAEKVIAFIDENKDHLAPCDHVGEMCLGKLDEFYKR